MALAASPVGSQKRKGRRTRPDLRVFIKSARAAGRGAGDRRSHPFSRACAAELAPVHQKISLIAICMVRLPPRLVTMPNVDRLFTVVPGPLQVGEFVKL